MEHHRSHRSADRPDRVSTTTAMKTCLSGLFVLGLLLSSSKVSGLGPVVSRYYRHIEAHYTWQEAQSYCRTHFTDLATVYKSSDEDLMSIESYYAWIGLYRSQPGANAWEWSNGDSNYIWAWAAYEPHYNETCAHVIYTKERIYGGSCGSRFFFICQERKQSHYEYRFVPLSKTWLEAQAYCREYYDDLATLPTYFPLRDVEPENFPAWIGLHRDEGPWRWSTGISDYTNWENNEPGDSGGCVSISAIDKEMAARDCVQHFPFVCIHDNVVLVKENKTWEEALEHCRSLTSPSNSNHRFELLSVQPGEDQEYVMVKIAEADTEEVWAGLRFLAGHWLWINKADLLFADLPQCPVDWKHCGVLAKANATNVETRDCAERRNFVCYRK